METYNNIPAKISLIEDTDQDLGFRIRWFGDSSVLEFEVYEVFYQDDSGTKYFPNDGWSVSPDDVTSDITKAEKYMSGAIRWDGCANVSIGDQHWCGEAGFEAHTMLVHHLYTLSCQLMQANNEVSTGGRSC